VVALNQKIEKEKSMKNKLSTLAGAVKNVVVIGAAFVLVAVVAGVFTAGPAIAQAVRAALVANVDDPGRIPYQAIAFCQAGPANFNTCDALLPAVPAGKRLVITHVSGVLATNVPGGTLLEPLLGNGGGDPVAYLPTTFQGAADGLNEFVFNQPVVAYYEPGQSPHASVDLRAPGTDTYAHFTLTGYMIDCATGPCAAVAH
jgi:hypothetical protein